MVIFNKELHIVPLLITALLSSLIIALHSPPQPEQAPTKPIASVAANTSTTIALTTENKPEPIKFDPNEPKTWPTCSDDEWVWADNGKCHARPAAPAPSKVPVAYSGDCEQWRPLVAKYSWDVDVAMSVMRAESGCNPNAANWGDAHETCMGSFGLFQIACMSGQIFDPAQNVAIAWAKYTAKNFDGSMRKWSPWGVCNRGIVNCY